MRERLCVCVLAVHSKTVEFSICETSVFAKSKCKAHTANPHDSVMLARCRVGRAHNLRILCYSSFCTLLDDRAVA